MSRFKLYAAVLAVVIMASTGHAKAAVIGYLQGSQGNIVGNLTNITIDSANVDSFSQVSVSNFNSMSAGDLRSAYDVLVFGWFLDSSVDANWEKLSAYLQAGGGIIWEDPDNISDFAAAAGITQSLSDASGNVSVTSSEPILTDGLVNGLFDNNHMNFTAFSADWTQFLANSQVAGLFGEKASPLGSGGTGCGAGESHLELGL